MDGASGRRLIESVVGAYSVNAATSSPCELFHQRERNREVGFVFRASHTIIVIESGRVRDISLGTPTSAEAFRPACTLLIGEDGILIDDFLSKPAEHWTHPDPSPKIQRRGAAARLKLVSGKSVVQ